MSLKEQLKDEAKREKQKLSAMSGRDKIWYIWEYYKFYIIGIVIAVTIAVSIGTAVYRSTFETAFYCMIINAKSAIESNTEYLEQGFREYLKLGEKDVITVDSSLNISYDQPSEMTYAAMAKITALVASQELDSMITDEANIDHYAEVGGLSNLEELLPADVYDLVKDYIYYAKDENGTSIPCAISLEDTPFEQETGLEFDPPLLTIMGNTTHIDNCIALIHYLFG